MSNSRQVAPKTIDERSYNRLFWNVQIKKPQLKIRLPNANITDSFFFYYCT